MKFLRSQLLHFYDDPKSSRFDLSGRGGNVSAITGMIGEDLMIAILVHYWSTACMLSPKPLPDLCKQQGNKGKRLDRWVVRDRDTIFQVEIKNWSAHSFGGRRLAADASPETSFMEADRRWNEYFGNGRSLPDGTAKVLIEMSKPTEYAQLKLEKLLCFWFVISGREHAPMSIVDTPDGRLHVFSASMYLRTLSDEVIVLHVPKFEQRIRELQTLIFHEEV
jgi:hypothetical protein